jgi:hypothetical protein
MQKFSKVLIGIGILAGIVAAGIVIGWWGSRGSAPPPTPSVATPTPVQSPNNRPPPTGAESMTAAANPTVVATNTTATAAATNLLADWEDKLDEILGSDEDDTNKVKDLFAVFPRLPEEGQAEVAQHLSNLVSDDNYTPLGQLLQNTKLPDSVLDVLMSDVLNRPNSVKLPQLLQAAQNPDHPKADEAKDLIELYLDEDDPAKWPDKMQQWLKENPD